MQRAARRPMLSIATLTTVGALALAPIAVAPPELSAPSIAAARISAEAVQLTDAWSDLLTNTVVNVVQLGGLFLGVSSTFPLPNPTIPLAPVATQLVLNPLIYAVQLFTGQGAQIPTEIATHLSNIANFVQLIVSDVPGIIVQQIQTPFLAAKLALDSITTGGNLLLGLLEAPAVFLDTALNSQFGLIGVDGPIAVPIIIRNLLATALYTTPPTIVLPFKKAASTPTPTPAAATTVTSRVASPSGTASSARSKPKASSSAASSKRMTASAKAKANNNSSAGQGHGKRR
jgi:hypothetical protein